MGGGHPGYVQSSPTHHALDQHSGDTGDDRLTDWIGQYSAGATHSRCSCESPRQTVDKAALKKE
jgi:hypothetical protein